MIFENIYVNSVIFSEDFHHILYLYKTSGPQFLHNKYNFIGGRKENNEITLSSIIREIKEEAGIDISPDCLYSINYKEYEKDLKHYKLETFGAVVSNEILEKAYTAENEEVFYRETKDVILEMFLKPNLYNDDFSEIVQLALEKVPQKFQNPSYFQIYGFFKDREDKIQSILDIVDNEKMK